MDKLEMQTKDLANEKFEKLKELFPNAITETTDEEGKIVRAIDKDILTQEISTEVVDGREERYQFTWPDKRKAIRIANAPISKTLRPCREESVNFDETENLYIEGDNLEALKILQETYLGKVKMIYIDPPYNTGNDFVYNDNFSRDKDEYLEGSGQYDEEGNRLEKNLESNGRFHTDWLNMMYSRLKLARNLLTDDGVIFISIDDNEQSNLKKICDEIFGDANFVGELIRKTKSMTADAKTGFNMQHEYLLCYSKFNARILLNGEEKELDNYKNPDNDKKGEWVSGDPSAKSGGDSTFFGIVNSYTNREDFPPTGRYWAFSKQTFKKYVNDGKIVFKEKHSENERGFIFKRYKNELRTIYNPVNSLSFIKNQFMNQSGTKELQSIFNEEIFNNPKPTFFIKDVIKYSTNKEDIILDFFSGSRVIIMITADSNDGDWLSSPLLENKNMDWCAF